jgi:7-cyano-7-deazaguanine reductase
MRKLKKSALTQLGHEVDLAPNPAAAVIETVANPHPGTDYAVRLTAPEFTCLCPVTGQPDFAHFVVDYCPRQKLVESKSFKLFLGSFRNHPAFHEDTTLIVAKRLWAVLKPKYLRVAGYWYPRGGIPIDVFWQDGALPKNVWLPDLEVEPYRGRG